MLIAGAALVFAQIGLTIIAPDTITARVPASVRVAVASPVSWAHELVAPKLPPGYVLVRVGSETRVDSAGRRSWWKTTEHELQLTAARAGALYLPGFEVRSGAFVTRSKPKRIVVRAGAPDVIPEIVSRAPLDVSRAVDFHGIVLPPRVYVGQQATYQVGVFLDDEVRFRLRRNPEFHPPELRTAVAYDLPGPVGEPPVRLLGSRRYEVHVFQRALFPLEAGRYTVPPARLSYALPLSSSFFSREETHTVKAESVSVLVLEPPAAGRPDGYQGAVGQIKVETRMDSSSGRVGDPLLVTVRVSGVGNVKFFPRPALEVPWATAVPAGERVQLDTQAQLVRGGKEFDWLVTPRQSGTVELPAVRYPYFDPYTERYEIAIARPESLDVAPGTLATTDSAAADAAPQLSIRTVYRGVPGPPPERRPAFWWAALLAPLPAIFVTAARRPRRRLVRRLLPAARLRAAARTRALQDGREARRAYVSALADRLDLPPAVTARRGSLARALRRAGVTAEAADEAEIVLHELDAGAYAPGAPAPSDQLRARAYRAFLRVDAEARVRGATSWRRDVTALLATLGIGAAAAAGILRAEQETTPAALFARGVAAYQGRQYAEARRLFAETGSLAFHAPDAWANFGTAGWAAGDTAAAAVGWQRALRMEPTADDVRDRLALLPSGHDGPIAAVPKLPAAAPALAALVLWASAWVLAAYAVARALPELRPIIGAALFASAVLGGTALYLRDRLAGAGLVAFADDGDLRVLPALSAERAQHASTGEVGRSLSRQGAWTRVRLDGDREGWVETDRLVVVMPE